MKRHLTSECMESVFPRCNIGPSLVAMRLAHWALCHVRVVASWLPQSHGTSNGNGFPICQYFDSHLRVVQVLECSGLARASQHDTRRKSLLHCKFRRLGGTSASRAMVWHANCFPLLRS
jgi:hypothetical protein